MPKIATPTMLRHNTPVEDYREQYGLYVKREDLACPPPGPPFSKTRGVFARVASRPEKIIGVLDTSHSQAGHAVARACQILGKECVNFYPVYKKDTGLRAPQDASEALGARLVGLPAGRSCILFHAARKATEALGGYMMPNALKLEESVAETAKEVPNDLRPDGVLIPISSGTIAAGVVRGFEQRGVHPQYLIHLGYSRSHEEVERYIIEQADVARYSNKAPRSLEQRLILIDEDYAYKDVAYEGETPPWPCNPYYDLKAFRWWTQHGRENLPGTILLWNIG